MQPETAQQRRPDPWPFGPVRGSDGPPPFDVGPDEAFPTAISHENEARTEADALVARLRARRSTSGVAAAYAAAHGHPADPRAEQGARRWALTGTTAVVAVVAVLLLGVVAAALSMRGDGVETLAPVAEEGLDRGSASAPAADGEDDLAVLPDAAVSGAQGGASSGEPSGEAAGGGLLVHVVGEVARPGLVTLADGARVADAVEAAGGVNRKGDLTAVNLARAVVDGEQLYVPRPGEPVPGGAMSGPGGSAASAAGAGGTGGAASGASGGGSGGTVDINTADAVGLEALPGVGPSIAQAIIEWRETNGAFASVDELDDVPGIGPATLDELRDSARVGP
ncbi:helix-hairpin-helix domain-containing protein [Promicromonospora sukumoe]|uniref:helix-hairpin-helix domain-containing protein n=1 Tax=Promicromonospora sukumoe TaxID=88382 RepID=UPI00365A4C49